MNEVQLEAQTIAEAINMATVRMEIASTNTVLLKNGGHRLHLYIYQNKSTLTLPFKITVFMQFSPNE